MTWIEKRLFPLLALMAAYLLGDSYIGRLPHHAGYFLMAVEDQIGAEHEPPRHSILILIDGLGLAAAEKLEIVKRLREQGQCRITDVGALTVSRPVYAVVSTGLEQDRTGSRNNDEVSPLAADSIWQAATRAGKRVTAASPEEFWKQLFPDGFTDYVVTPREGDVFPHAELADLTLIHPLYVDDAGHAHGGASLEYAGAAARADREALALLSRIDLARDLVVFTADHGHMSYGGHGGPQEEVRFVLTCIAGKHVRRSQDLGRMDARSIGPLFAMLAGLPFPRHMRAGEDDLDVLFSIADVSSDYLADRRAAVERFRRENERRIGSWSEHYRLERSRQHWRMALVLALIAAVVALMLRRRPRPLHSLAGWALTIGATIFLFVQLRGSFTVTAINNRGEFIQAGFFVCGTVGALSLIWERKLGDRLMLTGIVLSFCLGHIAVFGWPLGFPLPSAELFFFPFLAPIFVVVHALIALILSFTDRAGASREPH